MVGRGAPHVDAGLVGSKSARLGVNPRGSTMAPATDEHEQQSLRVATRAAVRAVSQFQKSLTDFATLVNGTHEDSLSGDELEQAWRSLRKHHRSLEACLADLAEAAEDAADIADARAALQEPGNPVPWEEVKAELGLS